MNNRDFMDELKRRKYGDPEPHSSKNQFLKTDVVIVPELKRNRERTSRNI